MTFVLVLTHHIYILNWHWPHLRLQRLPGQKSREIAKAFDLVMALEHEED